MTFKDYLSAQFRKPDGLFGRFIISRLFDKGNAHSNAFMKEVLSPKENERILEIGFGTGQLINEIARYREKGVIEGIDFSEAMVAVARKRNRKHIAAGKVILRRGDFEEIEYDAGVFDGVCSCNTIYFWGHPENYIKKINRILRPGGKVVLAFRDRSWMEKRPLDRKVFRFYDSDDVKALFLNSESWSRVEVVSRSVKDSVYHCAVGLK